MKNQLVRKSLFTFITICEALLLISSFFLFYTCPDHAEHLFSSWLIWNGEVPYRDFFEHHNPLLWYLLAPIVGLMVNNALILYVSRVLCGLMWGVIFWGLYRLGRDFLKLNKTCFGVALCCYFAFLDSYYIFWELRPDFLMLGCFIWGLYFGCRFLKMQKQRDLTLCFGLFAISFLFLQKVLVLLIPILGYGLYLLMKKRITMVQIGWACLPAGGVILLFFGYLYAENAINIYWLLNFDLNAQMMKLHGINNLSVYAYWLPIAGLFGLRYFLKENNPYRNLLVIIWIWDIVSKGIFGASYVHYFIFSNLIAGMIFSHFIVNHLEKKIALLVLICYFLVACDGIRNIRSNRNFYAYYQMHKMIMAESNSGQPLINGVYTFINLYGKRTGYYWFGYGDVAPVAQFLYGIDRQPDIEQMIVTYKPKFEVYQPYPNLIYQKQITSEKLRSRQEEHLKNMVREIALKHELGADETEKFVTYMAKPFFYGFNPYYQYYGSLIKTPFDVLVKRGD